MKYKTLTNKMKIKTCKVAIQYFRIKNNDNFNTTTSSKTNL